MVAIENNKMSPQEQKKEVNIFYITIKITKAT